MALIIVKISINNNIGTNFVFLLKETKQEFFLNNRS